VGATLAAPDSFGECGARLAKPFCVTRALPASTCLLFDFFVRKLKAAITTGTLSGSFPPPEIQKRDFRGPRSFDSHSVAALRRASLRTTNLEN